MVERRFVIYYDAISMLCTTAVEFFQHFFISIDKSPTRINLLNNPMLMQYSMCAGHTNAEGCLHLTISHMTILCYQLMHSTDCFYHNKIFLTGLQLELIVPAPHSS